MRPLGIEPSDNAHKTVDFSHVSEGLSPPAAPKNLKMAHSYTIADENLRSIIAAWPTLPEALRAGITAMVKGVTNTQG